MDTYTRCSELNVFCVWFLFWSVCLFVCLFVVLLSFRGRGEGVVCFLHSTCYIYPLYI